LREEWSESMSIIEKEREGRRKWWKNHPSVTQLSLLRSSFAVPKH